MEWPASAGVFHWALNKHIWETVAVRRSLREPRQLSLSRHRSKQLLQTATARLERLQIDLSVFSHPLSMPTTIRFCSVELASDSPSCLAWEWAHAVGQSPTLFERQRQVRLRACLFFGQQDHLITSCLSCLSPQNELISAHSGSGECFFFPVPPEALPQPISTATHGTKPLTLIISAITLSRFDLIPSSATSAILGSPWLVRHNSQLDWEKGWVAAWSPACHSHCLHLALSPSPLAHPSHLSSWTYYASPSCNMT